LPYSVYLLYFVAVKPDHYWLPVFLPLFSCVLTGVDLLFAWLSSPRAARVRNPAAWKTAVALLAIVLVGLQLALNLFRPVSWKCRALPRCRRARDRPIIVEKTLMERRRW
jgi:hypothetical protein